MHKLILFLFSFFIIGCSPVYVDMNVGEGYMEMKVQEGYYESEIYSAAFSLPRLRSTGETEIRVWSNNYDTWTVSGVIATHSNGKQCHAKIEQTIGSEHEYKLVADKCKNYTIAIEPHQFQEIADILSNYDKQSISCPDSLGGWGGIIEGVNSGKRFSLKVFNPEKCDTPETNEIWRILESLKVSRKISDGHMIIN